MYILRALKYIVGSMTRKHYGMTHNRKHALSIKINSSNLASNE